MSQFQINEQPRPYWHPLLSGVALGIVLLTTFIVTGHGLGATGFTTRLNAWIGMKVMPAATLSNEYLGSMVETGHPLSAWITWQVIGLAAGAFASAWLSNRTKIQIDGARFLGGKKRPLTALLGGVLAGFGARIAAGCTSGLGLSGGATLSIAGFVFLAFFFTAGAIFSHFIKPSKP